MNEEENHEVKLFNLEKFLRKKEEWEVNHLARLDLPVEGAENS
jgi:hypothetical protein